MAMALRLEPARSARTALARRRAPRLLVGSSSTSTRQPTGERAGDLDELLRRPATASPTGASGRMSPMAELRRARRARSRASARRSTKPKRAGSTPSSDVLHHASGAARATAPGRSSPRRRGAPRADSRGAYGAPSSVIVPASGASAPARIAISVLLPAPFWPTSAHTSPAATGEVDAVERDRRAERLARCRASRERGGAARYFSHFDRSGVQQLLHRRLVHVRRA